MLAVQVRLGCVMEIGWIVCARCGAPGPLIERSREIRGLQGLCCRCLQFDGSSWLGVDAPVNDVR
jgi:hypothetical protein